MTADYAEILVELQRIHSDISKAMRNKRYQEADELCATAMSRLARLHVRIKSITSPIP